VPLPEHVDEHLCDPRERAGLRHAVLIKRCDGEEEHVGRAHGEREHLEHRDPPAEHLDVHDQGPRLRAEPGQ
jgi:hypothetical protein